MKKIYPILVCLLLCSCNKENLYEFHDLSGYADFIYRIEFYPIEQEKTIEFKVRTLQTNGYDQVKTKTREFSGRTISFKSFETSVKHYKLTGVDIFPEENIGEIKIFLYETGTSEGAIPYNESIYYHSIENPEPVSIRYNFETQEKTLSLIEED